MEHQPTDLTFDKSWKSVDDLIEKYSIHFWNQNINDANINDLCSAILGTYPLTLLKLLKKDLNKSSKYDLYMIRSLNKIILSTNSTSNIYTKLLHLYKRRVT